MASKRRVLLDALDAWRGDGAIDAETYARLRARVELEASAPRWADDGAREGPGAAPARRGFAVDSMQFVGGLLLGAGLVALVVFLDLQDDVAAYALLGLGALLLVPALALARRDEARPGLVEAALSGGLVPMLVAVGLSLGGSSDAPGVVVPALVALACVALVLVRRGEGPSVLVATGGFAWAAAAATLLQEGLFFGEPDLPRRVVWFVALLAYGALLLRWRGRLWSAIALAVLVAPLTLAYALLFEPLELDSVVMELLVGLFLGALLALGIATRSRGLVAGAAAGLTIDAVAFAFDVGGPGTAVVVLLALGGLLVWQAEYVRGYFRGRSS